MLSSSSRLADAFTLYIDALETVSSTRAYWAVLHVVCSVPDVCGALQAPDGLSTPTRYEDWCQERLPNDPRMKPADWYKMRCSLLHQGSSLPTHQRGNLSQYASISLVTPENATLGAHRFVANLVKGLNITLEITALAAEMRAGLHSWFNWLQAPEHRTQLQNVHVRLHTIMSPRSKMSTWTDPPNEFITWSSTGSTRIVVQRMTP